MSATKRLTLDISLPVEVEDGETLLGARPVGIRASGLTPTEADQLAEAWAQSDTYWVGVTNSIIDALGRIS